MATPRSRVEVRFEEKSIDALFESVNQCHLPGIAIGIALAGKPIYRKGFGLASADLPVVLSPSIRMRLGSTSKQFCALAYLLLCEQGRANIDDTVGKYFPDFAPANRKVTLRQLMGNISGLRDATDLANQFSGQEGRIVTVAELLSFYRDVDDTNAEPGSTYVYNNGGWLIVTAVIEKITGQSLETELQRSVFEPVGMYDTLLRRLDSDFVANSASAHTWLGEGRYGRREITGGVDFAGAAAVVSTVNDMLLWMAHMDNPKVGTAETWRLMKSSQMLTNGISTGYGMGLETILYRGIKTLQHAGGGFGSNAQMLKVPEVGLDVIAMSNRSDVSASDLVDEVLDACLSDLAPKETQAGRAVEGIFRSLRTGRIAHLFSGSLPYYPEGTRVQVIAIHGHLYPLAPDKDGVFHTIEPVSSHPLSVMPYGHPTNPKTLRIREYGATDEFEQISAADRSDGREIAGRYRSDSTGTDVVITVSEGGALFTSTGRFGISVRRLQCLVKGVWWAENVDAKVAPPWAILMFDPQGREFLFSNNANRELCFRRVT